MLELSDFDRACLAGSEGPAPELAMRILVRMAEVMGAPSLMDVEAAHIDSTNYLGEACMVYAERFA